MWKSVGNTNTKSYSATQTAHVCQSLRKKKSLCVSVDEQTWLDVYHWRWERTGGSWQQQAQKQQSHHLQMLQGERKKRKMTSELKISAINIQPLMWVKSLCLGFETSCDGKLKHVSIIGACLLGALSSRILPVSGKLQVLSQPVLTLFNSFFCFFFLWFCFEIMHANPDFNLRFVMETGSEWPKLLSLCWVGGKNNNINNNKQRQFEHFCHTQLATSVVSPFSPHSDNVCCYSWG